jgi:hypothetical protein
MAAYTSCSSCCSGQASRQPTPRLGRLAADSKLRKFTGPPTSPTIVRPIFRYHHIMDPAAASLLRIATVAQRLAPAAPHLAPTKGSSPGRRRKAVSPHRHRFASSKLNQVISARHQRRWPSDRLGAGSCLDCNRRKIIYDGRRKARAQLITAVARPSLAPRSDEIAAKSRL